ncbi:hypothetical protein [Halopseudomonas pelagia]|uniref:Uncharacterized protein n=1 Tax=Halopseudomonas pelagia TaxID=553151 RepID=A0AA91U0E0_9GAMM|nr:hypothetical protein [Halopseudomonas pelagia]PCC98334.1 hypothetical protein CO192_16240 [Halopseudomonas pelagia]QFY56653.1 hypothetical protein EAO82_09885 [Halopseudomonas pelagia]
MSNGTKDTALNDKGAGDSSSGATAEACSFPASYLLSLFGGVLACLIAFCLFLFGLQVTDNLPPPAFSNSLCLDEKLSFMRDNPYASPNLLVVGSSVAWRHVDGETLVSHVPGTRPLNGAFCGLQANQTQHVADWLLEREPTIKEVVMIVDVIDFARCSKVQDAVFDRKDVDDYVYEDAPAFPYYMRYFAPVSLMRNSRTVQDHRTNENGMHLLKFTQYGDGPLLTDQSRGLFYGQPDPLDSTCFEALNSLATRLKEDGRKFMVVSTPLHPQWKAQIDPGGTLLANFNHEIIKSLQSTGTHYWDADAEWRPGEEAFVDAIHMRWPAAQRFSQALAEELVAH